MKETKVRILTIIAIIFVFSAVVVTTALLSFTPKQNTETNPPSSEQGTTGGGNNNSTDDDVGNGDNMGDDSEGDILTIDEKVYKLIANAVKNKLNLSNK